MRILVIGSNGQLGQSIRLVSARSANEYIFKDVDDLDITNPEAVALDIKVNCYDVIVNCAAFTDVERAERQEDIAAKINGDAVAYLARAAKENDVTLIHISTDYVFDGTASQPIEETAAPSPCSAYGRTKYLGELAIEQSGCKALIFRTAWLYSEFGRNFVKTMMRLTSERSELRVVADQTGTPTYARDLAKVIVEIIETKKFEGREGIYNFTDEGVCSWYDLAKMTAEIAGNYNCKVLPCRTSEYPSDVKRPSYSVLDKTKVKTAFGIEIPYWIDSLQNCINNLING